MLSLLPEGYRVDLNGSVLRAHKGSTEHYFHFLLGYLLPTIWIGVTTGSKIRVLNCGPVMNMRLEEALNACCLDWEYWSNWRPLARTVILPRWDYHRDSLEAFRESVRILSERLEGGSECLGGACAVGNNLLLLRSAQPSFYENSGAALIKGYGAGRRQISNTEEVASHLNAIGVKFSFYEPGIHTLGCQMRVFQSAERVFGIRGAEWANLIWMKADSSACVVYEAGFSSHFALALARDLEVSFQSIHLENDEIRVNPGTVGEFFTSSSS